MKRIIINNKIFMVIIALLVIYNIYGIFKNFHTLIPLITGILIIIIYVISFIGLLKNNKSWAWILGGLPSLWLLLNPLKSIGPFREGYLFGLVQALSSGDPVSAALYFQAMLIPLAIVIFVIVNLVLFKKLDNKNQKHSLKQNKVIALLIAIFFSFFVWLYLKKYKKFFIWLGILVFLVILEVIFLYLDFYLKYPSLWIITEILGLVISFYIWISAIVDASKVGKIKLNRSKELNKND